MSQTTTLSVLSLFSGCGGFDLGAARAGFEIVAAFDNDPVAVETYRRNVSKKATLCDLSADPGRLAPKGIDLLLGGPPCQGFSSAGTKDRDDPRNKLWEAYLRVLSHVRPKVFVLENVYGFSREYPAFLRALRSECNDSYSVESRKINTQFYGVPQHRLRLFVIGLRNDVSATFPWPRPTIPEFWGWRRHATGLISMRDALECLGPPRPATHPRKQSWGTPHEFLELEPSHRRIALHVPNGGSLRSLPDAHLPPPYFGRPRIGVRGWQWFYRKPDPFLPARTVTASTRPIYSQVLAPDFFLDHTAGHWRWRPVSPADFTTQDGLYTSPVEPRRLSILECARLQTFPDSFTFYGTVFDKYRQIGNAVPVRFAEALCSSIAGMLLGSPYAVSATRRVHTSRDSAAASAPTEA